MTKPMLLSEFTRLPPASRACPLDGLSAAIDMVACAAPASHRFLRYQYYAAALGLYGGAARTMLLEHDGNAVIALPFVRIGPMAARLATVPGVAVPFRGFPAAIDAPDAAYDTLIDALAAELNALRLGPVGDDDPAFAGLRAAALRRGWAVLDRPCATPGTSESGRPVVADRRQLLDGAALAAGGFDQLAAIDNGATVAFWRAAAADSVLAAMLSAAILSLGDLPVAFTLHLSSGDAARLVAGGDPMQLETRAVAPLREWLLIRPGLPALLGRALRSLWSGRPIDGAGPGSL